MTDTGVYLRKKTAEDFRAAIKEKGLTRWKLRECGMCGTGLHYLFENDKVGYDSNCDCTSYDSGIQLRSYQDLADHYNMQSSNTYLDTIDDFFGFKKPE